MPCGVSLDPAPLALLRLAAAAAPTRPPPAADRRDRRRRRARPGYDGELPAAAGRPVRLGAAGAEDVAGGLRRSRRGIPKCCSYVPCFCGCERTATGNNDDCFVARRDAERTPRVEPARHRLRRSASTSRVTRCRCTTSGARRRRRSGARSISKYRSRHVSRRSTPTPHTATSPHDRRWRVTQTLRRSLRAAVRGGPRRRLHRHRLGADDAATLSANPHLKLMFGYAAETPTTDVRPFELERFVDPQARDGFIERLQRDGAVTDYLLRLRRADQHADLGGGDRARRAPAATAAARRGARCATSASASGSRTRRATSITSCCRPRSSRRSARRSPASRTS